MSFPVLRDYSTYTSNTGATVHTISYPASVKQGDLLIYAFKAGGTASPIYSSDTGGFAAPVITPRILVATKTADGTEAGGTFSITTTANVVLCGEVWAYSGSGAISYSALATGEDSGAVTLADTRDWRFIAMAGTRRSDNDYTASPTGYGSVTLRETATNSSSTSTQTFAWAYKDANKGTSEDPGAWTTTGTLDASRSCVIALPGCLATLSSPTSLSVTASTATARVTSDYGTSGTIYCVVSTSGTAPSAYQIKNGLNSSGAAATWSGSDNTPTAGTNDFSVTGLASSTTYYAYFVQEVGGIDSNVASAASFTTSSSGRTVTPAASSGTPGSTVVVNLSGYSGTPTAVKLRNISLSFSGNSSSVTVTLPALSAFVSGGTHAGTRFDTDYTLLVEEAGGSATATFQIDPPDTNGPTYWEYQAAAAPYPGDSVHPAGTVSGDDVFVEVTAGTLDTLSTSGSPAFSAVPATLKVRIYDVSASSWSTIETWNYSTMGAGAGRGMGMGAGFLGRLGAR